MVGALKILFLFFLRENDFMRLKSREKGKGKGRQEERREDKVAIREGLTVTLKLNIYIKKGMPLLYSFCS